MVRETIESCNKEIFFGGRQWINQKGCKGGSGVEVKGAAKICGGNKQVSGSLHIKYGVVDGLTSNGMVFGRKGTKGQGSRYVVASL